jgi:hypothetical protein
MCSRSRRCSLSNPIRGGGANAARRKCAGFTCRRPVGRPIRSRHGAGGALSRIGYGQPLSSSRLLGGGLLGGGLVGGGLVGGGLLGGGLVGGGLVGGGLLGGGLLGGGLLGGGLLGGGLLDGGLVGRKCGIGLRRRARRGGVGRVALGGES